MSKILFILRCYSGFEQSIINQKWSPSGAPTISKILERFQFHGDNNILFLPKSNNSKLNCIKVRKLYLKNLSIPIYLIKNKFIYFKFKKIGKIYLEFYHIISIIYYLLKLKPKLIYSDHANIFVVSLIARFLTIKTIIRLMGVKDDMRDCLIPNTFYSKILNWSYRAPFSLVIATQDGAGSEIWMNKILSKNVARKTLLNGMDLSTKLQTIKTKKDIHKNKTIVTFLGRLEESKAPDKFLQAFIDVRNKLPNKFHCFIIGSGSMKDKLKDIVSVENAINDVSFYSDIEHAKVFYLLSKTDIYVSLNRYGNLSNANIEAMCLGKAIIMPKSQAEKGIDIDTDKLITDNAVYKISTSDAVEELAAAIILLHNDRGLRQKLESEIKHLTDKLIYSWKKRIDWEFNLLNKISSCTEEDLKKLLEKI